MSLLNDQEILNTQRKLALLEKQIELASVRPRTDANVASLTSLQQMANQLREEIIRYRSQHQRQAS